MLRCPSTVGRDPEHGLLGDAVAAAVAGRGGMAFLLGEAGIGKSRLVTDASEHARGAGGMATLAGRCVDAGPGAPLRPDARRAPAPTCPWWPWRRVCSSSCGRPAATAARCSSWRTASRSAAALSARYSTTPSVSRSAQCMTALFGNAC